MAKRVLDGFVLEEAVVLCKECQTPFTTEMLVESRKVNTTDLIEADLHRVFSDPEIRAALLSCCPACKYCAWTSMFKPSSLKPELLRKELAIEPSKKYALAVKWAREKKVHSLDIAFIALNGLWCTREAGEPDNLWLELAIFEHEKGVAASPQCPADDGMTHLIMGELYRQHRNFERALAEYDLAEQDKTINKEILEHQRMMASRKLSGVAALPLRIARLYFEVEDASTATGSSDEATEDEIKSQAETRSDIPVSTQNKIPVSSQSDIKSSTQSNAPGSTESQLNQAAAQAQEPLATGSFDASPFAQTKDSQVKATTFAAEEANERTAVESAAEDASPLLAAISTLFSSKPATSFLAAYESSLDNPGTEVTAQSENNTPAPTTFVAPSSSQPNSLAQSAPSANAFTPSAPPASTFAPSTSSTNAFTPSADPSSTFAPSAPSTSASTQSAPPESAGILPASKLTETSPAAQVAAAALAATSANNQSLDDADTEIWVPAAKRAAAAATKQEEVKPVVQEAAPIKGTEAASALVSTPAPSLVSTTTAVTRQAIPSYGSSIPSSSLIKAAAEAKAKTKEPARKSSADVIPPLAVSQDQEAASAIQSAKTKPLEAKSNVKAQAKSPGAAPRVHSSSEPAETESPTTSDKTESETIIRSRASVITAPPASTVSLSVTAVPKPTEAKAEPEKAKSEAVQTKNAEAAAQHQARERAANKSNAADNTGSENKRTRTKRIKPPREDHHFARRPVSAYLAPNRNGWINDYEADTSAPVHLAAAAVSTREERAEPSQRPAERHSEQSSKEREPNADQRQNNRPSEKRSEAKAPAPRHMAAAHTQEAPASAAGAPLPGLAIEDPQHRDYTDAINRVESYLSLSRRMYSRNWMKL